MKKAILLFMLLCGAVNCWAEVLTGSCGENVTYSLDTETGVMKISGTGPMYNYRYGWTPRFKTYVKVVKISESVTTIGSGVFCEFENLVSINIPNSVTSIGSIAFLKCSSLESIEIPNSVTIIGSGAFEYCSSLTSVTIPNSVTSIDDGVFSECHNLISVTIPNSVTSIGISAFSHCYSLPSVTIPNSVVSIGEYAFYECRLNSLTIGSSVTYIDKYAFNNKPKKTIWLTNTPPSGYGASGTINYVLNDQFSDLNNVQVYPYLSSMFEVDGIKYAVVSPSERICDAIDCTYNPSDTDIQLKQNVSYMGVSMNVRNLMPYLCYENCFIENISIKQMGDIPNEAFSYCTNLQKITLENIGNIASSAFYKCYSLEHLAIHNAGNIGYDAFYNCSGLQSAIVDNVGTIGDYAFYNCGMNTLTLGEKVTSLGEYAFNKCSKLEKIVIPNAITSMGQFCFGECSALCEATIGDGIKTLPTHAFSNCGLNNVQIGSGVQDINTYAFSGCKELPSIDIPSNVNTIGNYAFEGCSSLTDVKINDRTTALSLGSNGSSPLFKDCPLNSVYIGGPLKYNISSEYGYSPFNYNTTLTSVIVNDTEDTIYDYEFYYCTNLKSVTIGDGVKTIGNRAFSGCSSLESFAFGESMESIGQEAFSDCTSLITLKSEAVVPPTCGTQALDEINKWECTLYVPGASISAYQNAPQWKDFFFMTNGIEDIKTEKGISTSADKLIYSIDGRRMQNTQRPGLYIINGKKTIVR